MNKKILFQFFVMFVLVMSAVAFASTYALTINVYDSASNPMTGDVSVYNSAGTLLYTRTNVQSTIFYLSGGTYTYKVSKTGYNTFTGSAILSTSMVKDVYLTADSTAPVVSITGAPASWQNTNAVATVAATDANGISSVAIRTYTTSPGTCSLDYTTYTLASPQTITSYAWVCGAAKDTGGLAGFSIPVEFRIDKTAPITAMSISPATPDGLNSFYITSPTVTLSSTDVGSGVATTYYKIDSGSATIGTSFTIPEGSHTVTYWSVDNAGNAEVAITSTTIKVDLTNPTINAATVTCSLPGLGGWCKGTATVTLSSSDSPTPTIRYTIDGGTLTTYSTPFTISTDGTHPVVYYSVDTSGRQSASQTTNVLIDKVAPITTHSLSGTLGLNGWYLSDIIVTLLRTDATSGAADTQYKINSGSYATIATPFTFTIASEGTSTFNYYSTDVAGNAETAPGPYSAMIDKIAPTINSLTSLTHPIQTNYYGNDPSLQWTASDATSGLDGFSFIIDQNAATIPDTTIDAQETTLTTSYTNYADGVWYFHIRAVDNAGLWGITSHYTIRIDTTVPVISLCAVNPASDSPYNLAQSYTFSCTITDANGINATAFTLGGNSYAVTNVGNVYTAIVPSLAVGTYNYNFLATDTSGLQTTEANTYNVALADSALTLTITPVSPAVYGTAVTPTCAINNLEQTIVLTVDSIPIANGFPITDLNVGSRGFQCSVIASENYSASSNGQNYIINKATTILHISVNGTEADQTYIQQSGIYSVRAWSDLGSGTITLTRNGVTIYTGVETTIDQSLTLGVYTYVASFSDSNYQATSVTRIVTVTADSTAPVIVPSATAGVTYVAGASYTFSADVTDNVGMNSVTFTFNGVDYAPAVLGNTYTVVLTDLAANEAGYTYSWSATDVNANSANSGPLNYIINKAAPSLFLGSTSWSIVYGDSVTITGSESNIVDSDLVYILTRDGTAVTNGATITPNANTLGYVYVYGTLGGQNFTVNSITNTLYVAKAAPTLTFSVDPTTPTVYGIPIAPTCAVNNLEQTPAVTLDGAPVANNAPLILGAKTDYEFVCTAAESTNYIAGSYEPIFHNVTQAPITLSITLDGFNTDRSYIAPASYIVNASSNAPQGTYALTRNGVNIGSGVSPSELITNEAGMILGDYTYRIELSSQNYTATPVVRIAYVVADSEAPQYFNQSVVPASGVTYAPGATYTFNIDWTDNVAVTSATLRFNGVNYAPTVLGNTYTVALNNLAAGTYSYQWTASDATGNTNQTGTLTYVIASINPVNETNPTSGLIHLSLNGNETNITVEQLTSTTALGWKDISEGTITLYLNNNSVGLTDTQTLGIGIYNYTLALTGATNYTNTAITRWLTVVDTTPPAITITAPGLFTSNVTTLSATTNEAATCYFGTSSNPTTLMGPTGMSFSTLLSGLTLGPKTYYVKCVDAYGNSAEVTKTWTVVNSQDVPVTMGWNLISLSLIPSQPVLTNDASIWGTNYVIQHFDGIVWLEYNSTTGVGTLVQVVPDKGYWLYADTSRTITILGTVPGERTINLVSGTNMIGWTSTNAKRMDLALWFIRDNVTNVQCQDTTDLTIKSLRTCAVNTESFEPGKGYFVNVSSNTQWVYPLNIPPVAMAGADQSITVGGSATLNGVSSYDLDGTIVSYSWNLNGNVKTGSSVIYGFDSVGTYTIKLTVTDNNGAVATDDVVILVSFPPSGGGGGGGGASGIGGGNPPVSGGYIQISLSAPGTITAVQGQTATFSVTVTNTGQTNVYDVTLASSPGWTTISPGVIRNLAPGESGIFSVALMLPNGTKAGTQSMTLTASGNHPKATVTSSAVIQIINNPAQCANCPEPTAWTTCDVNNTQTRTSYTCDDSTGFSCVETTETRTCSAITGYFTLITDNPVLSAIVGLLIILIIASGLYYSRNKAKVNNKLKSLFGKLKPQSKPEPKKQGIDFSIEYGDKK